MKTLNRRLLQIFRKILKNKSILESVDTKFVRNPNNLDEIITTKIEFIFKGKLK